MRTLLLWLLVWAMHAGLGSAQVTSGPAVGSDVPPLVVYAITGPLTDTHLDYAAHRRDQPTVYLLIARDKWDRPMARFLKQLDQQAVEVHKDVLLVAVWLTDTPDDTKNYLPLVQQSLQLQHTALTYFHGDGFSPNDWAIHDRAHLTVVLAYREKVTSTMSYVSVNETDVPSVLRELQKAVAE